MVRDYRGDKYGRLTINDVVKGSTGHKQAVCRCDCGKTKTIRLTRVLKGVTASCGCLQSEVTISRNKDSASDNTKTLAYKTWRSMIQRAKLGKGKHVKYQELGVCDSWRVFKNFFTDMGDRPFPTATIERIDNTKGYSPDNCKWANYTEQERNRTNNHLVTLEGETKCLSEWIELKGLNPNTVASRLRYGWSYEDALC